MEGLFVSHCPMVPFSAYDFHFVLSFPCRSCRDGHSAKVSPCFLERPLLFVLLLALFMVRIIFSRRSCRDRQFLSFNEERNQRRSKRKFPLLELPLLPRCSARSGNFVALTRLRKWQDTPLGAVMSLRIGSLRSLARLRKAPAVCGTGHDARKMFVFLFCSIAAQAPPGTG